MSTIVHRIFHANLIRKLVFLVVGAATYPGLAIFNKLRITGTEHLKKLQRNWIGKSEGSEFEMNVENSEEKIEVYTTRIDTVYGMTYVVVAPEHPIIENIKSIFIRTCEDFNLVFRALFKYSPNTINSAAARVPSWLAMTTIFSNCSR